ncbi:MAG TPA: prolyl oligopeptidase family serine peptidase [Caulobacteraceae bacterium]|jgi:dipeptidyl aminopeptidase/acylaminoacyl peptidase|nr:prolyl oligopeptidase family serine peptidase [Caulobacteraceae bacterium]
MSQQRPYGAWTSAVSAAALAEGAIGIADLRIAGAALWWLESRPADGGRNVVMTWSPGREPRQATAKDFNVRTRVHEYGGAAYVVAPDGLWFSNFRDQRLYRQAGEEDPAPMTPEGLRYADATAAPGGGLIAVREDHTGAPAVRNAIVRLSGAAGEVGEVLFGESDFVAYPRVSPDGRRLAWIAWDFPAMPWDETRLYVADLTEAGLENRRQVAGGTGISAIEPQWTTDGALVWISDESGFWNLYEQASFEPDGAGAPRPVSPRAADFGGPLWTLGRASYAILGQSLVAAVRDEGHERLVVIDRATGSARALDLPFVAFGSLQALDASRIAAIGYSAVEMAAVVVIDIASGVAEAVRRPSAASLSPSQITQAEPISFASAGGRTAHALFYPPTNPDFHAPPGEAPPLIVQAHGGPTGAASPAFNLGVQFWTSRGFALVDVDYGGSTGYGRAYRERLKGQWGVVDVEDVVAAARSLAQGGRVDPRRIAIHGGSAGGFTVLAALAQSDVFAAGGSFYGVADLEALARDTHKFESRYLDGLIGPWPQAKAVYDARSPINQLDGFSAPLLILQGSDDPVVPPNQAHMIRDALRARGVPVAFIEFAGESHGWRRAETIVRAKEAELSFYGQVFGFTPADAIEPVQIEGLAAGPTP